MRNRVQISVGVLLLLLGLFFSSFRSRPWLDFDFILAWYGILLLLDNLPALKEHISLFRNFRTFLILAFTSSIFWWFYEWANLYLKNWDYPLMHLYSQMQWGFLSTVAFTTVLPLLAICTNIVTAIFRNKISPEFKSSSTKISRSLEVSLIAGGIICLALAIIYPISFFGLIWLPIFLIFDPINALSRKSSLISEALNGNFKPLALLTISALFAGLLWETVNHFIPKWTYPIVPWFWQLPFPITAKFFEMPLMGLLGYIPFCFGAFAFVKFLNIDVPWLEENQ